MEIFDTAESKLKKRNIYLRLPNSDVILSAKNLQKENYIHLPKYCLTIYTAVELRK